eukprot:16435902-Heterocapsa_arctica.AAC.1
MEGCSSRGLSGSRPRTGAKGVPGAGGAGGCAGRKRTSPARSARVLSRAVPPGSSRPLATG